MGFGTPGGEVAPKSSEVVTDGTADMMMTRVSKILKQQGRVSFQVEKGKYTVTVKLFKARNKDYLQVHFNSNLSEETKHFSYLFQKDGGNVIVQKNSATDSEVPDLDNGKITQIYDWVLDKS